MSKLFVRERAHVAEGDGVPRFEIVAVSGLDLKVYHSHVRKSEVEALAADTGASIVYLPRGEGHNNHRPGEGKSKGKGKSKSKSRSGRRGEVD
jgi:hypothetical protein